MVALPYIILAILLGLFLVFGLPRVIRMIRGRSLYNQVEMEEEIPSLDEVRKNYKEKKSKNQRDAVEDDPAETERDESDTAQKSESTPANTEIEEVSTQKPNAK